MDKFKTTFTLENGLHLEARLYGERTEKVILCLPGLTRNAKDFDLLATALAEMGYWAVAVSFRGRGRSDYDPDYRNYHPETYRDDVIEVLDSLETDAAVIIGTSLGGIVGMLVNEIAPERVKGVILNDVGPELAPEGFLRIASYAGKFNGAVAAIHDAADYLKMINQVAFPDADEKFWLDFAANTFRQTETGDWALDYDLNIGKAFAEIGASPDLWPAFKSLKNKPCLLIRGALSDLLTPPIVEKMRQTCHSLQYAEVPRVGHAPTLTEPFSLAAIKSFLAKLDECDR